MALSEAVTVLPSEVSEQITSVVEHVLALSRHRPDPLAHIEVGVPRGLPLEVVAARLQRELERVGLPQVGVSTRTGDVHLVLETVEFYR